MKCHYTTPKPSSCDFESIVSLLPSKPESSSIIYLLTASSTFPYIDFCGWDYPLTDFDRACLSNLTSIQPPT